MADQDDFNLQRAIHTISDKSLRDDPQFKKAIETVIQEMLSDNTLVSRVQVMARYEVARIVKDAVCAQINRAVNKELMANSSVNDYIVQQTQLALNELFNFGDEYSV